MFIYNIKSNICNIYPNNYLRYDNLSKIIDRIIGRMNNIIF